MSNNELISKLFENIAEVSEIIFYFAGQSEGFCVDLQAEGVDSLELAEGYIEHTNIANHKTFIFIDKISAITVTPKP